MEVRAIFLGLLDIVKRAPLSCDGLATFCLFPDLMHLDDIPLGVFSYYVDKSLPFFPTWCFYHHVSRSEVKPRDSMPFSTSATFA